MTAIPGLTVVRKPLETYLCVREGDGDRELTAAECDLLYDLARCSPAQQAPEPVADDALWRAAMDLGNLMAIVRVKLGRIVDSDELPEGKEAFVAFLERCNAHVQTLRDAATKRTSPQKVKDGQ